MGGGFVLPPFFVPALLEHCAKKWVPVFRKSNALNFQKRSRRIRTIPFECDVILRRFILPRAWTLSLPLRQAHRRCLPGFTDFLLI
jgi:hypothetical protein